MRSSFSIIITDFSMLEGLKLNLKELVFSQQNEATLLANLREI
ncbi:hypothetical protein SK578_0599 [Streptococcus mitis]|uniref:Uncharacterized protein n=1 Tax=Streptococcus mitis TaxID=28037 RepID=A0A081QS30_STRMT|nr:hypothetical protein SK578_0599 [Streptococcus mitis]KYF34552.1 hypothetical protein SMIM3I_01675 [Streptococcus mitis]KYF36873.1 hypothetical protein SMIM3IV_01471 [Streptococcus mitis]